MKRVYVEGYGCTLNAGDTIIIKNSIKERNFEIVNNIEESDIILINTCIVRLETEHKMISRIKKFKKYGKKIVVAGCMPKALRNKVDKLNVDGIILPKEAYMAGDILKNLHNNNTKINNINNKIKKKDNISIKNREGNNKINKINKMNESANIVKKLDYLNGEGITAILPISEGCIGKCSFCIVKVARGNLISYPMDKLLDKVKEYVNNNVKYILLTAQDTGCYGFDKGYTLPDLLNEIVDIEGEFIVRIGMMHAKNVPKIMDDLIECYKSDKICKFFHLPLQSGDNKVLKDMNREYTVEEYCDIVKEFKSKIKDLTYNTDVIVGFPTETEDAFQNTLKTIMELKPDYINSAKYTQREHTIAGKMKQLDTKIRKERSKIMDDIRRRLSYENNKKYIGKKMRVLITENGKGLLHNCKVVKFDMDRNIKVGKFYDIKITDAKTFGLYGRLM